MNKKINIEEQINASLETAKKINPVELSPGFTEKVMAAISYQPIAISRQLSANYYPTLLRVAAVFIIIVVNVFTLKLELNQQPDNQLTLSKTIAISDFVNAYQVNDANVELLTTNNTNHEQR